MNDHADNTAKQATSREELERQVMDSNVRKNEREWWAQTEIAHLREIARNLRNSLEAERRWRAREARGRESAEAVLSAINEVTPDPGRKWDGDLEIYQWIAAECKRHARDWLAIIERQPTAWDTNPQCCFDDVAWQMRMHYHKHGPRWWEWGRNVDAVWGAILRLAMRELVKSGWRP